MHNMSSSLIQQPELHSYIQVLRLLRSRSGDRNYLNRFVRTRAELSFGFPATEVRKITQEKDKLYIDVTFLGLYGASSPLPAFYTEELLEEAREEGCAVRDFYDLISQPFFNQYFQAWSKYRLLPQIVEENNSALLERIFSLAGISTRFQKNSQKNSQQNNKIEPEVFSLFPCIGLFTHGTRSAEGLFVLVSGLLPHCPVKIEENVISMEPIPEEKRCLVNLSNNCIGDECYLGKKIRSCSNKLCIHIQVNSHEEFESLLPGKVVFNKLQYLLKHYLTDSMCVEISIKIMNNAIMQRRLYSNGKCIPGVNIWLNKVSGPVKIPVDLSCSLDG